MRFYNQIAIVAATLIGISPSLAQQPQNPPANPLDNVPDKMSFNIPYGAPITAARAQAVIQAAEQEANRRGWPLNIAVADSGGNLVAFLRMDGAQLGSIPISEHKARASVRFRRATRAWEESLQKSGYHYILTLDDVIASRGGIPLVEDGKVIGGVGCSGGTGSQDEVVCAAGAAVVNK
jgi:glc operon protein GlcG